MVSEPIGYAKSRQAAARLDATFSALADPTRRAILSRLARGSASVKELTRPFAISQPAVSKHLRILEKAGLITRGKQAQMHLSRLRAKPLKEATDYLQNYRRFWERRFESLDALLSNLQQDKK